MIRLSRRVAVILAPAVLGLTAPICGNAGPEKVSSPAIAAPAPQSEFGQQPVFEFHSGFWVNLHHFLYQQARQRWARNQDPPLRGPKAPPPEVQALSGLPEAERSAWAGAVETYQRNYADKDLVFNSELVNFKNRLAELETCPDLSGRSRAECDAGLPSELTRALEATAPVYRAHWWPGHDRGNREWIAEVAPLVRQMGGALAKELAGAYQTNWPAEKIRVDVSAYANWAGAYTTLDPLHVSIASSDPRNQGNSGLEILFHESSHALAGAVNTAIARECRQRGKPIPRDLWHALLFYTTGEVVKGMLRRPGVAARGTSAAYTPYAFREGLYDRGWANYLRVLEKYWKPYLEGRAAFDDAIARMISSL